MGYYISNCDNRTSDGDMMAIISCALVGYNEGSNLDIIARLEELLMLEENYKLNKSEFIDEMREHAEGFMGLIEDALSDNLVLPEPHKEKQQ